MKSEDKTFKFTHIINLITMDISNLITMDTIFRFIITVMIILGFSLTCNLKIRLFCILHTKIVDVFNISFLMLEIQGG